MAQHLTMLFINDISENASLGLALYIHNHKGEKTMKQNLYFSMCAGLLLVMGISMLTGCKNEFGWTEAINKYKNGEVKLFVEGPLPKSYMEIKGVLLNGDTKRIIVGMEYPELSLGSLFSLSGALDPAYVIDKKIVKEKEMPVVAFVKEKVMVLCSTNECGYTRDDIKKEMKESKQK
ncbi:MAG: hypothetical protein Q7R73_01235 [bacterium]|nr:hypothetical protein [bacterium]